MKHQFGLKKEWYQIEWDAECMDVDTHCALVMANLNEFNNSGYWGMADLCADDHDTFLWYDDGPVYHCEHKHDIAFLRDPPFIENGIRVRDPVRTDDAGHII